ncbi:MAG TPA: ATP-binding protein [Leptospiraceae bacterium]|nr:ATP-binding protein [Leptospiraceae bacterium]
MTRIGPGAYSTVILHLDPDEAYRSEIGALLHANGLKSQGARSLGEALELVTRHAVKVVVTELDHPDAHAEQILESLHRLDPSLAIIVLTSRPERRQGPTRRLGRVFEFVEKSQPPHILLSHIQRGRDYYLQRHHDNVIAGESEGKLRSKLEWLIWKQQAKLKVVDNYATLVNNVKHSVAQGAGLDVMCTLVDLLMATATEVDGKMMIEAEVLPALNEAAASARRWLENLDKMLSMTHLLHGKKDKTTAFHTSVQNAIASVHHLQIQKNQTIALGGLLECSVMMQQEGFELCVRELLTNAFKYSPESSRIDITAHRAGDSASLTVLSDVMESKGNIDGIPAGSEEVLFEPLVRLNNSYDERFRDEELAMGFGLAIVQSLVSSAGGRAYIREIRDFSVDFVARRRVLSEIVVPILKN